MKNIFKFAAVAVIASMTLVACNNNKPAVEEDTTDTTQIEQCCDEMTMDTVADTVATVEEETPAAPAPKKTTVKKAAENPGDLKLQAKSIKAQQKAQKAADKAAKAAKKAD